MKAGFLFVSSNSECLFCNAFLLRYYRGIKSTNSMLTFIGIVTWHCGVITLHTTWHFAKFVRVSIYKYLPKYAEREKSVYHFHKSWLKWWYSLYTTSSKFDAEDCNFVYIYKSSRDRCNVPVWQNPQYLLNEETHSSERERESEKTGKRLYF